MNKYDFLLLNNSLDQQENYNLIIPAKALTSVLYYFDYVGEGLEEEVRQISLHEEKKGTEDEAINEYKANLQDMQKIHKWLTTMLFKISDPKEASKETN